MEGRPPLSCACAAGCWWHGLHSLMMCLLLSRHAAALSFALIVRALIARALIARALIARVLIARALIASLALIARAPRQGGRHGPSRA